MKAILAIAFLGIATSTAVGDTGEDNGDTREYFNLKARNWRYFDGKEEPKNWSAKDFDDSKWKTGQAILGYGDTGQNTTISFGGNKGAKHLSAFFRKTITVKDPSQFKKFIAAVVCDDGYIMYVNGKEVHRHNIEEGKVSMQTLAQVAIANNLETSQNPVVLNSTHFTAGTNIIAVRVHQATARSSDLSFGMSLIGTSNENTIRESQIFQDKIAKRFKDSVEQLKRPL